MGALDGIQEEIQQVAEQAGNAVVGIGQRWGVGSGVVLGKDQILTNAHNVRGEEVSVTFPSSHCRTQVGEGCASRWVSLQVSNAVSEDLVADASPAASSTTPRCCLAHPADRLSVATDDYWA